MNYKKIFFIIFFFLFFNHIFCEEIPIITISAGKFPKSLGTVGSNVTIINSEQIENSNENFLADIIDENSLNTNIFQSGGAGNLVGFQIRGLEKRYSTIYIDGVKMSDPSSTDNSFYLQNVMKNSIERIEILKGNQSVLYGPNAITGTIHIFTKKGTENDKTLTQINFGSNNTKDITYSYGGSLDKVNYYWGINKFSTDGISARNDDGESDGYNNIGLISNLGYQFKNNIKLQNSIRYSKSKLEYDAVPIAYTDLNNESEDVEATISSNLSLEKEKFTTSINLSKYYIERKTTDHAKDKQNYFGYRDGLSISNLYNFSLDNRIVYGVDFEKEAARYAGDYAPAANNFLKFFKNKVANEEILSQYFDLQLRPLEQLYTTFGFRNDKHTSSGKEISGKTSAAYHIDNLNIIKSSFGSSIRFPSLYDLHFADGNTNSSGGGTFENDGYTGLTVEDIKPERANSFDINYEKNIHNYNTILNIGLFHNQQKNPLNSDSRNNWKMANTEGTNKSKGVEFAIKHKPKGNKFSQEFNYVFNDTYDSNTCNNNIVSSRGCNLTSHILGNAKVRIPRNYSSLKLNYKTENNFSNSIFIKYVGERRDFGDANNSFNDVILKDYKTFDFISKYDLANSNSVFFKLNNIFNEKFEEAHGYSSTNRSLSFGLKFMY